MEKKIRVLVAKPGLDGHDRGALVISQALRDQGMEVVYTGLRQTPEQIVAAAIQEDVDAIGLSCLSGAHNELFPEVVKLLKEKGSDDIQVIAGGVIPWEDIPYLEEQGVKKVFTPGSTTADIGSYIRELLGDEKGSFDPPKKIDHIGIAVQSIEEALPFYAGSLNLKLEKIEEVPSEKVKVAFMTIGETRFELLEPTADDSPIAAFLQKRGPGIHHIALAVDNIDERIEEMKTKGIKMINDTAKEGADDARIAFIHPKSTAGVLYELTEKAVKEG